MLDSEIISQLKQYLELLEADIILKVSVDESDSSNELKNFVEELANLSTQITLEYTTLPRTPSFTINRADFDSGITFAGVPLGHEFSSFVLALLQTSGRVPRLEEKTIKRIKAITGSYDFVSYVSLTCQNCPDVVQSLNMLSVLNPNITHTMVDGAVFSDEVTAKDILAVPTVYLNNEVFSSGRISIEEILTKMGVENDVTIEDTGPYDVLVIGGGPAGVAAAIYAARKGVKTALIAKRFGGQIKDTLNIENLIGTPKTTGPLLANDFKSQLGEYDISLINNIDVTSIKKTDLFEVKLRNNLVVTSKTVIVATGAVWRELGIPGEAEFKNKGIAFCPHCDGPLFKDKPIAVVGGGNSGIEAAIDLAGTSSHVTVLEFMPELNADSILQDRLKKLPNVDVLTNVAVSKILGDNKVEALEYISRDSDTVHKITLDGVFIQIGLAPNTKWLNDFVETNRFGEIIIDNKGATNIPGLFAAGDCTTNPYKQIVIAMGSGATAALAASEYLIKN